MTKETTLDVVILPFTRNQQIIDFPGFEETSIEWLNEYDLKDSFNLDRVNIISMFPERGKLQSISSDIADIIRKSGDEAREYIDKNFDKYCATKLSKNQRAVIAGLFALQFFPEYVLPEKLSPKDFKKVLAGLGAGAGFVGTGFNPFGALLGAFLGYFSPAIAGTMAYTNIKTYKLLEYNDMARFKKKCLGEITKFAGSIESGFIPANYYFMKDFYEELFKHDATGITSKDIVVIESHSLYQELSNKILISMERVLKNKELWGSLDERSKQFYKNQITGIHVEGGDISEKFLREFKRLFDMADAMRELDRTGVMSEIIKDEWRNLGNRAQERGDPYDAGKWYMGIKDYQRAAEAFNRAISDFERKGDKTRAIHACVSKIECLRETKEYREIGEAYEKMFELGNRDEFGMDFDLKHAFENYQKTDYKEGMIGVAYKMEDVSSAVSILLGSDLIREAAELAKKKNKQYLIDMVIFTYLIEKGSMREAIQLVDDKMIEPRIAARQLGIKGLGKEAAELAENHKLYADASFYYQQLGDIKKAEQMWELSNK